MCTAVSGLLIYEDLLCCGCRWAGSWDGAADAQRAAGAQGIFDEQLARLYTAEIVLAISHLHSLNFVHRDLKPVSPHPLCTNPSRHLHMHVKFNAVVACCWQESA